MTNALLLLSDDGAAETWRPTTLRKVGKDERFLESIISKEPELLGFDPYLSAVRGPFVVFRQLSVETPLGKVVRPDLVLFSESGHVVVVELKLEDNPELKDR